MWIPPGDRTKHWSHSLHQRAKFLVVPWIKNLLDSRNLTVYLHPVLRFSGESMPMSVNELWFGVHFACLLNKALTFEGLWNLDPHEGCETINWCVFAHAVPFQQHSSLPCLFGELLLILQNPARMSLFSGTSLKWIGALPPISWCFNKYLPQHLPLSFNRWLKSVVHSRMWIPSEQGPCLTSGLPPSCLALGLGQSRYWIQVSWMNDWIRKHSRTWKSRVSTDCKNAKWIRGSVCTLHTR